jgi:hypothetical protein
MLGGLPRVDNYDSVYMSSMSYMRFKGICSHCWFETIGLRQTWKEWISEMKVAEDKWKFSIGPLLGDSLDGLSSTWFLGSSHSPIVHSMRSLRLANETPKERIHTPVISLCKVLKFSHWSAIIYVPLKLQYGKPPLLTYMSRSILRFNFLCLGKFLVKPNRLRTNYEVVRMVTDCTHRL